MKTIMSIKRLIMQIMPFLFDAVIRFFFWVTTEKMQFANMNCKAFSSNRQKVTIWKLGKNRFT